MTLPQLRVSENNLKKELSRLELNQNQTKKSIDMEKDIIRQSLVDIQDVRRDPVKVLRRSDNSLNESVLPLRPKSSGPRMGRRHSLPMSMTLSNSFDSQISKIKLSKSYGDDASCTFTRLAQPKHPVDSFKYMSLPKKQLINIDNTNKLDVDILKKKQLERRNSVSAMYLFRHRDENDCQSTPSGSSMFLVKSKTDDLTVDDLQSKSKSEAKNLAPWEEDKPEKNSEKNNTAVVLKQTVSVMSPVQEDIDSDEQTEDDEEIEPNVSTTPEPKTDSTNEQDKHDGIKVHTQTKVRKKKKVKKKKSSGADAKANRLKQLKREAKNERCRATRTREKPVDINKITANNNDNENKINSNESIINNLQRIKSARRRHSISSDSLGLGLCERTLTPRPPPFEPGKAAISRGRRKSISSLEPTGIQEEFDVSRELRRSLNFGNISVPLKLHLNEKKIVDNAKRTFQDDIWNDVRNCRYLRGYTPPSMKPVNGELKLIDSENDSQLR